MQLKYLITSVGIVSLVYFLLFIPFNLFLELLLVMLSPDGQVTSDTIFRAYWMVYGLLMVALLFVYRKKVKFPNWVTPLLVLAFVEIVAFTLIVQFPVYHCFHEASFTKYLTILNILGVALFSFLSARICSGKLKLFWGLATFGFTVAALDEAFMLHEISSGLLERLFPVLEKILVSNLMTVMYVVVGLAALCLFRKVLWTTYVEKRGYLWLLFIFLGALAHGIAAVTELFIELCSEEYLEILASFLYFVGVYVQYKMHVKTKK